ncbi:MAG TPA: hypothetical protein VGF08_12385 [Terriglobales bacterium]|jgi:hypothetical protein
MTHSSPTMEGFRTVLRDPAIALAEVTWRWAFGAAATALALFSFFQYLDTLPVSYGDLLFLRSRQPFLISQALGHMFAGSGQRLVAVMLVVLPALAVLWIVAASAGRVATVRGMLDHFRSEVPIPADASPSRVRSSDLFGLNFFRLALGLAVGCGLLGSAILAGFVSSETNPQPGIAFLLFLALVFAVVIFGATLNWFLSLASVFVVSEGRDTFGSLAATVEFCRRNAGPMAWSSTVFGLLHFLAFVLATSVAMLPMMLLGTVPRGVVLLGVLLVTLAYFAAVDFLYAGRLASYVAILAAPEPPLPVIQQSIQYPPVGSEPPAATIDQTETILSDQPLPPTSRLPEDDDILSDIPGQADGSNS